MPVKDKKSIKRYLLLGGIGGCVLLLSLLLGFGLYIILQYRQMYARDHAVMTSGYARQLAQDIDSMETYVKNLYGSNVHYQMLKQSGITESQWILATYYLKNNFDSKADNLDYFGGVFYYDEGWDSLCSRFSGFAYKGDLYRLNRAIKEKVSSCVKQKMPCKEKMVYEGETYLVYILGDHGKFLGYVINLSRYFNPWENVQLIISDEKGDLLINQGEAFLKEQDIMECLSKDNFRTGLTYMISREDVAGQELQLTIIHRDKRLAFWRKPEFWLLLILIPVLAFVAMWYVYRFVKRIIYQPIDHFVHRLTEMKKDGMAKNFKIEKRENQLEEIRIINEKLDELITEMGQLEQEKYKKEKEANAALLQYYQLQVKPHFFLNCLNIMASLLNKKDLETVRTLIFAVSRHFRYVFQDTNSLVELREEIEEVRSYCDIYMIKNAVPILLQIKIDEGTASCQVPILCVQTFVENSVKYAMKNDRVLSITLTSDIIRDDGQDYIRIHISDNGDGYQSKQLERMNQSVTEFQYHSAQVGVDNIKYRIYLQ